MAEKALDFRTGEFGGTFHDNRNDLHLHCPGHWPCMATEHRKCDQYD